MPHAEGDEVAIVVMGLAIFGDAFGPIEQSRNAGRAGDFMGGLGGQYQLECRPDLVDGIG